MTSPIDGRVADINRRIHGATARIDEVGNELGDYARASAEAASYVGDELRRLEDMLAEMRGHWLEEAYRQRLERAKSVGLKALDADLAAVLNAAAGHQGFAAQAHLFFNPPVTVELSPGEARLGDVNERIVEFPFAMAALSRLEPPARILDIGSAESTFPLSAASLGYEATAIDLTPLPFSHPNLTTFAGRFEDWEPPAEPFAAVFLISTIEHVGLGAYGEDPYGSPEPGTGGDRAMLERIRDLLAPDGLLVLTTPFGPAGVSTFQRTYDAKALGSLLDGWEILQQRTIVQRDRLVWVPPSEPGGDEAGVAMVVATPRRA